MNIEKEYKMLLNEEQFNTLLKNYVFSKRIQTNYYYQSNDNKELAIRIREYDNQYLFTLKIKKDVLYELEFPIEHNNINDPKICEVFKTYQINSVEYLGNLITTRYIYNDIYGQICLDFNKYNGISDFEIEYELFDYTKDYLEHFTKLLKYNDIKYIENKISKIQRFKNSI